jgi:hypothetical protein
VADDINRFWIPVAQILPVFILALVIEARAAFSQRLKELRRTADKHDLDDRKFTIVVNSGADISYAIVFLLSMVLLLLSFFVALGVLAFDNRVGQDQVTTVFLTTFFGAVLTGLLPVGRLVGSVATGNLSQLFRRKRGDRK